MISNCGIMRRICIFSLIMLLFGLQISAMTSPLILPEDITSRQENSFLHTLTSATNDNALATSGSERFRSRASALSVILFVMRVPFLSVTGHIPLCPLLSIYTLWNTLIGDELSALPQSDMVSRKQKPPLTSSYKVVVLFITAGRSLKVAACLSVVNFKDS